MTLAPSIPATEKCGSSQARCRARPRIMLIVSRFRGSGGRGRDRSLAPVARHFVGRRAKADRAGIVMRRSGMVLLVEAPARHGDGLVAIDRLSRRLARAGSADAALDVAGCRRHRAGRLHLRRAADLTWRSEEPPFLRRRSSAHLPRCGEMPHRYATCFRSNNSTFNTVFSCMIHDNCCATPCRTGAVGAGSAAVGRAFRPVRPDDPTHKNK